MIEPLILGDGVSIIHALPHERTEAIDLAPDGSRFVHVRDHRSVTCRDIAGTEQWSNDTATDGGTPTSIRYSEDGARIAVSSLHGHVAVIDAHTGATLGTHRVDRSPRGMLAWSPDGSRVLSVHGHSTAALAICDRDGKALQSVTLPEPASSVAWVDTTRIVAVAFQTVPILFDLERRVVLETFARPGAEIAVAASREMIALTADCGHLYLRALDGHALPAFDNAATWRERIARNQLRVTKTRAKGPRHTLAYELAETKRARSAPAPDGWSRWFPLPHGQTQTARFVESRLLLCDMRDLSLLSLDGEVRERLLLGVYPLPGAAPCLVDVALRGSVAAVSISSSNRRLPSQLLLLRVD